MQISANVPARHQARQGTALSRIDLSVAAAKLRGDEGEPERRIQIFFRGAQEREAASTRYHSVVELQPQAAGTRP